MDARPSSGCVEAGSGTGAAVCVATEGTGGDAGPPGIAAVVLLAVPFALGTFSLLVALLLESRIGRVGASGGADTALVVGLTALVTLPLAAAAGAVGAVCGSGLRRTVCCGALMVGTAVAVAVPWLAGPLAPTTWTAGVTAAVAGATAIGVAVCAGGWVVGHRSLSRAAG